MEKWTKKVNLTKLPHEILEEAQKAGLKTEDKNRSGTFFHLNQETVASKVNELYEGKLELMDIKAALKKYPWLEEYRWKLVNKDKDEYTKKVAEDYSGGYFMRILKGAEIAFPLQSCMMITQKNLEQRVHNIIIAEEDSKAHIITSCLQHSNSSKRFAHGHLGNLRQKRRHAELYDDSSMERKHNGSPQKRCTSRRQRHLRLKLRLHAPRPRRPNVPSRILQRRQFPSKLQQHTLRTQKQPIRHSAPKQF